MFTAAANRLRGRVLVTAATMVLGSILEQRHDRWVSGTPGYLSFFVATCPPVFYFAVGEMLEGFPFSCFYRQASSHGEI